MREEGEETGRGRREERGENGERGERGSERDAIVDPAVPWPNLRIIGSQETLGRIDSFWLSLFLSLAN